MKKQWNEIVIETPYENFENLENFLYSKDIFSFEIIDPREQDILKKDDKSWDFVDENLFKGAFDGITIKIYDDKNSEDYFKDLKTEIETKNLGNCKLNTIDDEDWKNNWKDFYHIMKIGRLIVKPSWEDVRPESNEVVLNLDPGMAFGTGSHETTYMCLENIEKYLKKGDKVLDIGCGSGILSIASKLLGAKTVIGTDIDEDAIEISSENAEKNNAKIKFLKSDNLKEIKVEADLIVSNIVAEILIDLLGEFKSHLKNNGILILSGIIAEKKDLVYENLLKNNFEIVEIKEKNEWVSFVARKYA